MITLNNVSLRRGAKLLLDKATVTLNPGEKVGLVGRNGAGKSTLFALLNGSLHEDGGDCSIPKIWRMAQVAQNMPETEETATDFVIAGDTKLIELRQALALAELAEDGMAMAHAHADLADAGEHDAISRAQSLILGLGFKVSELDQPVNSFSGGWRMRLQLARALMCPSDLLLLDEPTNHLDLDALVWLEAWLKRYPGTMIVISHDREFLDAVTNVTLHIEHAKLNRYGGNYSSFETMRAQQLELQQASFAKQQEKIAHLQKFITRFKAKASKAKQAQSRVKALERMEKIAPVLADAEFTFEFKEPQNLPNPMLAISDASFGYQVDGTNKIIIKDVKKSVLAGQRIGILGANGQGKSTLVKTIARTMPQLAGVVTEGKGLNIGYFAQQELDVLRSEDNPLEHMIRLAKDLGPNAAESGKEQDLRNFLGTFNFAGDMVKQAVGTMSGGEKARLVLAMIVWQRPNLLLLDEPTNHLDLATREALSMALNEFEGTVMLVSHDRALLRAVCDEFWLVGRGEIKPFDGDLDDYQQYLLDESKRLREEAKTITEVVDVTPIEIDKVKPVVKSSEQKKLDAARRQEINALVKPIKKKIEKAEKDMADLNRQKFDIETQLSQPISPAEIAQLGKNLKLINENLATIEEQWLEWVANIDEIEASFN
ncbi:ABC-F family ATP-binding cassette domain-containing protein [Polynucleobacter victoriensis]|uniref:Probable ATP-binding protein YheS n=1 Tax=Polynucleobacter victoriensis TaxID=2049319 RepID=A0A212T110_9BURK|nr:ATP-binding cassette domain-containing protein [Polynucleobacter victoriensis]SNC59723.1 ATP-binding cassette, subfamily F, member 3 [Polynucleobacter victoriensis]